MLQPIQNHEYHHWNTKDNMTQSMTGPWSAQDRYFTSRILQGHFCSAILKACLFSVQPRFHAVFPYAYLDAIYQFPQRQNKFLWRLQHLSMVNKFFEDMISVSLVVSLSLCYTVLLELQSLKLLSVMLSPTSQLCLNSFLGLEGTSICPPIKVSTDIRPSMCLHTLPYLSRTSANTQCLQNDVF